jgi:2-phospho-L-lactate guanylyltransferase
MKAVLIPVKDLGQAKQRLAPVLTQADRTKLALAMMQDVFAAVTAARGVDRVFLVSSYGPAIERGRDLGWEIINEERQTCESDSVDYASGLCAERGVAALLRLPIDIPLVQPEDIDWLMHEVEQAPSVVIVPSGSGGTNAILRSPPTLFPSHFGPGSLAKHSEEAQAKGARCKILRNERIELDVDEAKDLRALLTHGAGRQSAAVRWLTASGIASAITGSSRG